jgi:Hint domain
LDRQSQAPKGAEFRIAMADQGFPVGVYALDQVGLPADPAAIAGSGLADRRVVWPGVPATVLRLVERDSGLVLAAACQVGGAEHLAGADVGITWLQGPKGQAVPLLRLDGRAVGVVAPSEPAEAPGEALAGFAAETLIDTPDGPRMAGQLQAGDRVTTLANGSRSLVWVGRQRITPQALLVRPDLRPVAFLPSAAGNLGQLVVSPKQRLLIDDWRAEVYFGADQVLVAAQALVDDRQARLVLPSGGVAYVQLLCDRHEVLIAEGALADSFHPAAADVEGLSADARASLAAVVPEADLLRRRAAYPIVRNAEARALRLPG